MKVSVIIPSFNHERFISGAINSVLSQTYSDYEILISDDCSTDGTRAILSEYERKTNIRVFYQPCNIGAVNQISFLANQAKGEYLALLNSDDKWRPEKLEKQVAYMDANPNIDICFTSVILIDEFDNCISKSDNPFIVLPDINRKTLANYFFFNGNFLCHPSMIARKGIYLGEQSLNSGLQQLPDFDLWCRLISQKDIMILNEPLTMFRRLGCKNTSACTERNKSIMRTEQAYILKELINNLSDNDFSNFFSECFISKDATGIALECEKYFLLLERSKQLSELKEYAYIFYLERARDYNFSKIMIEKYNYHDKDFFKVSKKISKKTNILKKIYRRMNLTEWGING